jgi:PAS domain S-box-containing protein
MPHRIDFRVLFESSPGLYLVLDSQFQIVAVTNTYLAATMTKRDEIVGRNIFDVFPDNPDDRAATGVSNLRRSLETVRKHLVSDTMAVQKYDIRRPPEQGGGFEARYWTPVNSPVLDSHGRLRYIIHRVKDVTEFVELQEQELEQEALTIELQARTAKMEVEIVQRSRDLHAANLTLRATSNAKNDFLSRMSHELRSPLMAIVGFGELLRYSELDEKQQGRVTLILKAAEHLSTLVTEVLDLSRIEAGDISISPEPVSLRPLIDEALDLMRPLADQHEIGLEAPDFGEGVGHVVADNQRLKQVLINLISNAVKYNREGGKVRVLVEEAANERVRIAVEDTGVGIAPESMDRLFVPFERLTAASTEIQGTGLGLALSRTLIEAMGGRIGVESTPGEGSRFWVEVNRTEPAGVLQAQTRGNGILAVRDYPAERVLLYVEDTVANVNLIEGILERRPSVRLIPAMLGQLGLELARQHSPDLILLDMHLPDLAGEEVLSRLQLDPATRDVPVIILSADATRERDSILAAGARAFLTKPIAMRDLLEVVDTYLGADPEVEASYIRT